MSSKKTIYFIRHGQSVHNVYEEAHCHEPDYKDPNFFDAELSELGKEQVASLPKSVEHFVDSVDLVIVSPLTRAIHTSLGAFSPSKHNILVHSLCREQVSNACDIGIPRSSLVDNHPHFDFSTVHQEMWWYQDDKTSQVANPSNYKEQWIVHRYEEPIDELTRRISEFRDFLASREEEVITVVGHSNFFKFYLGHSEKLKNCEVFKHVM